MQYHKVYIIILNWNGKADTLECLDSLKCIAYPNYKIVVVDNGSTDGSEEAIRAQFPDIIFIQTGMNLGYAGGNNVGIKHALDNGADYIWLLNNDTIVGPAALTELTAVARSDDKIGMVGSKIFYHSAPDVIWYAGAILDLDNGAKTAHIGSLEKDCGQYDTVEDVGYVTGCSLLVKRETIESIGLIPEVYFLYFEEAEWNLLAQRSGYRTVIAPKSVLWHKVSENYQTNPTFLYYVTRNRFIFVKRNHNSALKKCINLQANRARNLLLNLWINHQRLKAIKTAIIISKAWIDGLLLNKSGITF